MLNVIYTFIAPLSILLVEYIIFKVEGHSTFCGAPNVKMKFNSFKYYYYMNPDRYSLQNYNVLVFKDKTGLHYDYAGNIIFSYFDTWKYLFWKRFINKREKMCKENSASLEVIRLIKEDIAKVEGQSKKLINKSTDDILKYIDRENSSDEIELKL